MLEYWHLGWAGYSCKEAVYALDGSVMMLACLSNPLMCSSFSSLFAIGGNHMLPLLAVQPDRLQFIPSLVQPQPLLFVISEMLMRCAPDNQVKRQSLQMLLDVLQDATTTSSRLGADNGRTKWVDSSSSSRSNSRVSSSSSSSTARAATASTTAAAVLTSYGTTRPLLGALVTASKVTAAEVKWTLGNLGVMLKQLLLLSKLTFEVLGQLVANIGGPFEGEEAGCDDKQQQQHAVLPGVSRGGHDAAAHGFKGMEEDMDRVVDQLDCPLTPAVVEAVSATCEALCSALTAAVALRAAPEASYGIPSLAAAGAAAAAGEIRSAAATGTAAAGGAAAAAVEIASLAAAGAAAAAGEVRSAVATAVAAAGRAAAAAVICNNRALSSVPEVAKARTIAGIGRRCAEGVSGVFAATLECPANGDLAMRGAATLWAEASMTGDILAVVNAVAAAENKATAAGDNSTAALEKEKCSQTRAGVEQGGRAPGTTSKLAPHFSKERQEEQGFDPHAQHDEGQQQQQQGREQQLGGVECKQTQGQDREPRQQRGKDWGDPVLMHAQGQQQQRGVEDGAVGQGLRSRTQQLATMYRKQQVEGLLWAGLLSLSVVLDTLFKLTHAAAVRAQEKADIAALLKSRLSSDLTLTTAVKAAMAATALRKREDTTNCKDSRAAAAAAAMLSPLGSAADGDQQSLHEAEVKQISSNGSCSVGLAVEGGTLGEVLAMAPAAGCPSSSAVAAAAGNTACEHTQSTLAVLQEVPDIVESLLKRVGLAQLSSVSGGTDDGRMYDSCLDQQGELFLLEAACFEEIECSLDKESGWWHDASGLLQLRGEAARALFRAVQRPALKQMWEGTVISEVQELIVTLHEAGRARRNNNTGVQLAAQRNAFGEICETFVVVQSILWRLPVAFCCGNNVRCKKVEGTSEVGSVVGRSKGVCQRCRAACYCSRQCQEAAWPFHQQACNAPT